MNFVSLVTSAGRACATHRPARAACCTSVALAIFTILLAVGPAVAQTPIVKLAAPLSLTGAGSYTGVPVMNAVRLAVEEANASEDGARIEMQSYDDHSTDDGARGIARDIIASDAIAAIGPGTTTSGLAAGPIYAGGGMAALLPYAVGAGGPASPTTFRVIFSTRDMGEALALHLHYMLGGKSAVVIYRDNGFGRPIAAGFKQCAESLGIATLYKVFTQPQEAAAFAREAATDPDHPAIVLAMIDPDATPVVAALARQGAKPLILGSNAVANDAFAEYFKNEPEYQHDRGFFTDGIYAVSPLILDSANAEALAFAARYKARYGILPRYEAAQSYDAARLAITAGRQAVASPATDTAARRTAVLEYLKSLDSPEKATISLTGPLWFKPDRSRQQAVRVGRFNGPMFESAPLQFVPALLHTASQIASGEVVDIGSERFLRRQQVVYAGIFLNEISRVDVVQSTFTIDFYFWLRFAKAAGAGAADPADIDFPNLQRGGFDPKHPATQRDLDDGTGYRLWRVRGDFKNDFDLRRYPFDSQSLVVRLFNTRAASDLIVYAQDRRSVAAGLETLAGVAGLDVPLNDSAAFTVPAVPGMRSADLSSGNIAPDSFRNLTQWNPMQVSQLRDVVVTQSALGDPQLAGAERVRELSGYRLDVGVRRRTASTLAKTLLPLGIMTLIMLSSLWFPHGLVKEKITVAITGALSGSVLLASVNTQLGTVGYTIAAEYVFYVFFSLCLLCTLSVLASERLRVGGRAALAVRVENLTRAFYLAAISGTLAAASVAAARW